MSSYKFLKPAMQGFKWAYVGFVYLFLFAPLIVVVGASFDGGDNAFVNFPPTSLSLDGYWNIPARYYESLWLSVILGLVATVVSILLGVPAALGLVRSKLWGTSFYSAILRAPLQIPFVVTGIAFLQLYYFIASIFGVNPLGTFFGLAVAHCFISLPYVVGTVSANLQRFDIAYEEAAISLGASRWRTFRRVTLPIIVPGIYAGSLYAFVISFGDVPVSLFLGSAQYTTFPVELFHSMEFDFDSSILAISSLILVASLVVLWLIQRAVGLEALHRSGGNG